MTGATPPEPGAPTGGDRINMRSLAITSAEIVAVFLAGYVLLITWQRLSFVVLPFAIAILITALLEPVARFMKDRLRMPSALAAVLTVLVTLAVVMGTFLAIAPQVVAQGSTLVDQITAGIGKLPELLQRIGVKDADVQQALQAGTDKLKSDFGSIAGRLGSGVLSVASVVASVVGGMLLVLMMLIYLLMDGGGFWNGILKFVPADRRDGWRDGGRRAWSTLRLFIRGQVLVSAIDGVGVGVGLWLVGVPLAVPLGVMTFFLSLIPTVGAIVAGTLSALVALSSNGFSGFVWAVVIAVVVQQVEGNILYPILIGRSLSLHPMAVLLAVGAGTALLGIIGSLLATPILAAIAAGKGWLTLDDDGDDAAEPGTDLPEPPVPEPSG